MITVIILLFAIVFFAIMWHYRVENDRLKDEIKERKREYDVLYLEYQQLKDNLGYVTKTKDAYVRLSIKNAIDKERLEEEILHLKRSRNGLKGRYKQLLEAEKRKTEIANKTVCDLMKKVDNLENQLIR